MQRWDNEAHHNTGDISKWVKDRSTKGAKGILSLHSTHEVLEKGKRGYAGSSAQPRKRDRTNCWDSSTAANTTCYDSGSDRHCRAIVQSNSFKVHAKKQLYAIEAHKAQRRFGSNVNLHIREPPPDQPTPLAQPSQFKKRSFHAQQASRKALHLMRLKKRPSAVSTASGSERLDSHREGPDVYEEEEVCSLPVVPPKPPMDDQSDADAEGADSPQAKQKQRGRDSFDPSTVKRVIAPYAVQRKTSKKMVKALPPAQHGRSAHSAPQHVVSQPEDVMELARRVERLEQEKHTLADLLHTEQAKSSLMTTRLNDEIQKKVKSSKRALTKDGKLKELLASLNTLQVENQRLRERSKQTETKADRCNVAEKEKRRASVALQQKESMFRDLQELLAQAEAKLAEYENSGLEPKARTGNLDREHLKIRLQQEAKSRASMEKRLFAAEMELDRVRKEAQRMARSNSSSAPMRRTSAAHDGDTTSVVHAQLQECQRERDRLLSDLSEATTRFERERQHLLSSQSQALRREHAAVRRLEEKEGLAKLSHDETTRRAATLEHEAKENKREVGETKLSMARLEAELRHQQKMADAVSEEKKDIQNREGSLKRSQEMLEAQVVELSRLVEQGKQEVERTASKGADELQRKQLCWERDRSELLQQNAKMRMRETELAAEASIHCDQTKQLRAQLSDVRKANAASRDEDVVASNLTGEYEKLKTAHDALKAKFSALKGDRSLSQKVCKSFFTLCGNVG